MVALSHVVQSRRSDLMHLRRELEEVSSKGGSSSSEGGKRYLVTRKDLDEALKEINSEESDREIFDRLFTLFDKTGSGKVHYLEYVVGLSVLVNASFSDRVLLSFELRDDKGQGSLSKSEVLSVFRSLSSTASFLGDPTLEVEEMQELVESLFTATLDKGGGMDDVFRYGENIDLVTEHPIIDAWLRRAGVSSDEGEDGKD